MQTTEMTTNLEAIDMDRAEELGMLIGTKIDRRGKPVATVSIYVAGLDGADGEYTELFAGSAEACNAFLTGFWFAQNLE